jgi:hypothetical protein
MTEETKEEKLSVTEEKDGSVVVELPEGMVPEDDDKDDDQEDKSDSSEATQEASHDDDDGDQPGDTDAIREARRARRRAKKDLVKKTREEKDQKLVLLQRQNQELMERLSSLERKNVSAELARFDKAIEDENMRVQYAQRKMQEATDASDGQAFIKAQEAWYESRKKLEAMKAIKQRANEASSQQTGAVNPEVQRYASDWMKSNDWYDPNGKDTDSRIAKVIDEQLSEEGWDPARRDYWEEFDKRLQNRLPHLYNDSYDEQPRRRPRSVVTGSGREVNNSRGGNTFTLSAEQVRAIKEAGMWDDPTTRNRMIKRYALEAKKYRG